MIFFMKDFLVFVQLDFPALILIWFNYSNDDEKTWTDKYS